MKLLMAGGCFRLNQQELAARQRPPEVTLALALLRRGIEVTTVPLENLHELAFPGQYDLVHVHHLSRGALVAALLANRPVVFTAHGTWVPDGKLKKLAMAQIVRSMSRGVCLSHQEAHWCRELFQDRAKFEVIPNGVELPLVDTSPRHSRLGAKHRMLFVGQLIPLKRVDWCLRLLVGSPERTLTLVYHNDLLLSTLLETSVRLGVRDQVEFLGQLSGQDLFDQYRRADLLLLPSETEALPSVITEAISCRLPVVASNVGGVERQIGGAGKTFDVADFGDFNRAVRETLANYPSIISSTSERSEQIRDEASVEQMADKHIQLYESILVEGR